MADPVARSPLHHRHEISVAAAARISERPFDGKLVLRGDAGSIGAPTRKALGLDLPIEPCTVSRGDDLAVLWIGPDEWWIVTAEGAATALEQKLGKHLAGTHHQIVDVSDYYTTIAIAGPRTRDMLIKLTTLDVHPRSFPAGHVAGSMFGRTQATIWHVGPDEDWGEEFRLVVRRSTADYLWCLLAEAGREFGLPEQTPRAGETWRLER